MFENCLKNVRKNKPLIHSITNYVTANDCANILLALGAFPIMADAPEEAAEITDMSAGLCINLGTLSRDRAEAMLRSGKCANEKGVPVVLDPVGVAASGFRTETAKKLLNEVKFNLIRGNLSEIKALAGLQKSESGVDSKERINEDNLPRVIDIAKTLSRKSGALVSITGAIDIVTDGERTYCIRNGHPDMAKVTGTGCQLTTVITAFLSANKENMLEAATAAICAYGFAGEKARGRLKPEDGNASYRNFIIDAIYNLTEEELQKGAKYEMR